MDDLFRTQREWDGVPVEFGALQHKLLYGWTVWARVPGGGAPMRTFIEDRTLLAESKQGVLLVIEAAMESSARGAVLDWRRLLWDGWAEALLAGEV